MDVEAPVRAQRGDLIVVQHDPGYLGEGQVYVRVGIVTSVTRDGNVKRWKEAAFLDDCARELLIAGYQASYIAPKDTIDVPAALATAADHRWPGDRPGMPYGSLSEARDALRPHLFNRGA
jgi:hypothetical protein